MVTSSVNPLSITFLYTVFAAAWILVSDSLLLVIFHDMGLVLQIQSFKGLLFVMVTALLLYLLLHRAKMQFDAEQAINRRSAELLRENEQRLSSVMDATPDAVFVSDVESGHFIFVNRIAVDRYGYSKEALLTMSLKDITVPALRDQALSLCREAVKTHHVLEWRHHRSDGTEIPVEIIVRPLVMEGREYILSSARDVSERKRSADALRESSRILQHIIDHSPSLIYMVDLDGRFKLANQKLIRMFSHSSVTLVGHTRDHFMPRNIADQHRSNDQRVIESQRPLTFEEQNTEEDGTHTYLTIKYPLFDENGRVTAVGGISTDITERKKSAEALQERENKLSQLLELLPVGISILDDGGKIFYSNPALQRIIGQNDNDVRSQSYQQRTYIDGTGKPMPKENFASSRSVRENNAVYNVETGIVKTNGEIVWTSVSAVPVRFIDWKTVIVTMDITQSKLAENKIQTMNAELEQRVRDRTGQLEFVNKELESFAYSVSHDLRAPLRGIDGWGLALLEEFSDVLGKQGNEYLSIIRSETQRMGMLIDDLLQLSRITRMDVRVDPVSLSDLARNVIERLQKAQPDRSVHVTIGDGMLARGDIRLLDIALSNLLENAFKFTSKKTNPMVEFGQSVTDGATVYFIRDNGVGFDMAYAGTMFGAFRRFHKTSEFPGSGVGLAIVQRIIHRHHGRIWAESTPENGAVFYFTL